MGKRPKTMSNDKSFKHIFRPVGKYIIIRSIGNIKEVSSLIAMPEGMKDTYKAHRRWEDNENFVFAIGDEVTKVKIGDRILFEPHRALRRIDKLTKIVEEKTGFMFKTEFKDKDGKVVNIEETEKYFAITEDEIICVVN